MVKKSILFYTFLAVTLLITSVVSFDYALLIWYLISLIGNGIIIQQAITKKPDHKKILIIISSFFILLPVLCLLLILFVLGGISC